MARRRLLTTFFCAALAAGSPRAAAADPSPLPSSPPVPITTRTLPNGLRVVLQEDHRTPIASVSLWYRVGSKDEPAGKSGFAHLFEHVMFQGSKHVPEDTYMRYLERAGATDVNGATHTDRTAYYETVPSNQLELALWLESDCMGFLLSHVDGQTFAVQRGVVKNERTQNHDSVPYGLVGSFIRAAIYPPDHPYHWPAFGNGRDLDAATVADVRDFFRAWYVPGNATLVIAGDIDPAKTSAMVEKYFGPIVSRPTPPRRAVPPVSLRGETRLDVRAGVDLPRVYVTWATPAFFAPGDGELDVVARVLTGGKTSRLFASLVHDKRIAEDVRASQSSSELGSMFEMSARRSPGTRPTSCSARSTTSSAKLARVRPDGRRARAREDGNRERARLRAGEDLVAREPDRGVRAVHGQARRVRGRLRALRRREREERRGRGEDVAPARRARRDDRDADEGGAGVRRDRQMKRLALLVTPLLVAACASSPPPLAPPPKGPMPVAWPAPLPDGHSPPETPDAPFRNHVPEPGPPVSFAPPEISTFTLANGARVLLVERHDLPLVSLRVVAKGGAGELALRPGEAAFLGAMIEQGTASRSALQISDAILSMGASHATWVDWDAAQVTIEALATKLDDAIDLVADLALHPAFPKSEVDRLEARWAAALRAERTSAISEASNATAAAVYGRAHPYGHSLYGKADDVTKATPGELASAWRGELAPGRCAIVVAGDVTRDALAEKLERAFASWKARPAAPRRALPAPGATGARLVVVDRPGATQSHDDRRTGCRAGRARSRRRRGDGRDPRRHVLEPHQPESARDARVHVRRALALRAATGPGRSR